MGIRAFILAPEGHILVSYDFSQMESRVDAFYCRDPKMMETYRTGSDIHAAFTSVIFGISYAQAVDKNTPDYKERHTIAKNVNFGVFYGLFPRGFQWTLRFKTVLNKLFSECEGVIANLKAGYPNLSCWQEQAKKAASAWQYTQTFLGRR